MAGEPKAEAERIEQSQLSDSGRPLRRGGNRELLFKEDDGETLQEKDKKGIVTWNVHVVLMGGLQI